MRIAVFGATGMAGAAIVAEAIARGHHVIAASRQPSATASDDERFEARAVDVDDPEHVPVAWTTIAQASLAQYDAWQEHPCTRWVHLSPPSVFEPGERSGSYLRGTTALVTDANGVSRITAPDLAIAVLDELENPDAERHVTVAQHPAPCPFLAASGSRRLPFGHSGCHEDPVRHQTSTARIECCLSTATTAR